MKLLFCSIAFIGLGLCSIVAGILNRGIKSRKAAIWIGIGLAAIGAVTLAVMYFFGEDRVVFVWALCMAAIMFITAFHLTSITFRCRLPIMGKYEGANRYSGSYGMASYSPVFTYEYGDEVYQEQTAQSFPMRHIRKNFSEGEYRRIYIDPEKPDSFICEKKPNIILWVLGVVFLVCALLLI